MQIKYILILFLSGCNATVVQSERLPLGLPDPPEVKMRPVNWEVQDTKICLSPEAYSNLSLNTEDIKAFVVYQNKTIKMYKQFYEADKAKKPK